MVDLYTNSKFSSIFIVLFHFKTILIIRIFHFRIARST